MNPELGSIDFVEEWNTRECVLETIRDYDSSLQVKIQGLTLLGGSPWLFCWAYGSTLGWKDSERVKHGNEIYTDMFKLKNI